MIQSQSSERELGQPSPGERMSALFANLIIQQTNMALMLLGRVPNPETGERVHDLESAKMFIDQIEMLEAKTKGNLDKREEQLLKQSLTTLRMAFVEAVESAPVETGTSAAAAASAPGGATAGDKGQATSSADRPAGEPSATTPIEEHRPKFSKKY